MRTLAIGSALLVTALVSATARADDGPAPPRPAEMPVVGPWQTWVSLSVEASLTLREVWEPVSVAPDFYVGLPGDATVGLIHSTRAAGLLDSGAGLCFGGEEGGCDDRYAGVGIDGTWRAWTRGGLGLGPRLRFFVSRFAEPSRPRLAPGVVAGFRSGILSILADAHLRIGLSNRDRGNASAVNVPLWVGVEAWGPTDFFLRTGIDGPLSGFSDQYAVPLGVGVGVNLGRGLRLESQLAFPELLGPLNSERARDLLVRLSYRAEATLAGTGRR